MPDPLTADEANDDNKQKQHMAMLVMNGYASYRNVTNYETFDVEADAMATDDAMLALKKFFLADRANREELRVDKAATLYEEVFAAWKRVLSRQECRNRVAVDNLSTYFQQCRDLRDIERYQEDMYEKNMKYLGVSLELHRAERRMATLWVHDFLRRSSISIFGNPFQAMGELTVLYDRAPALKFVTPLPIPGPLDGDSEDGKPWVSEMVKMRIKEKLGLIKSPAQGMPEGMPPGPGMPPKGGIPGG